MYRRRSFPDSRVVVAGSAAWRSARARSFAVRGTWTAHAVTVSAAIHELPSRERRILFMRFVEDRTQEQIAQRIGVSQMHVSRLERESLWRLRETLRPA